MIKNNRLRLAVRGVAIVLLVIALGLFAEEVISNANYAQTEADLGGLIEDITEEVIDTTIENPDDFPVEEIVKGSTPFHARLLETNADYVGWITLDGLSLDYPIVLGNDNAYYLTHSFYKKYSKYGTIFMDYRNKPDFSQPHTVLYGHHMRNNTMFARLDELRKKANYAANSTFTVYTPSGTKTYRIFSVYPVDASTTTIALPAIDADIQKRIADYKKKSLYATGVDTSKATRLITLVTCTWVVDNGRLLVHAIEVDEP
jgi:sortase B